MGNSNKIVEALEGYDETETILTHYNQRRHIYYIFILPASWFTGLVTNKTLADNRISLTDQF